jgi:fluoride exporter
VGRDHPEPAHVGVVSPLTLPAVAVGGALGALLRWLVGEAVPSGGGVPWPTLVVNATGCLALALLVPRLADRPLRGAFVGPGVLGGFTTMSAYADETRALLADGSSWLALGYVVGTLAACLGAAALARRAVPR